jgi:hypothetical protein
VCCNKMTTVHNMSGWPEPYIYTVYDRKFGDFPVENTVHTRCMVHSFIHIHCIYMVLANPKEHALRSALRIRA